MAKPSKPVPSTVRAFLLDSGRVSRADLERVWPTIEEMLTLFYPPFRADTDEELLEQTLVALRRYVLVLSRYDRQTLERGWEDVVSAHKTERWPVVGVIDAQCNAADPQRITANARLPGEKIGYDAKRYPSRARPNYDYKVEMGLMTREDADRMKRIAEQEATGGGH